MPLVAASVIGVALLLGALAQFFGAVSSGVDCLNILLCSSSEYGAINSVILSIIAMTFIQSS